MQKDEGVELGFETVLCVGGGGCGRGAGGSSLISMAISFDSASELKPQLSVSKSYLPQLLTSSSTGFVWV